MLSGGVSTHFKAWQPFYVREAKGSRLVDVDGNEYVDLIMGFGPNLLGHSPERIMDAVAETMRHGTSLAIATPLEVELARDDLAARPERRADALRDQRNRGDDDGPPDGSCVHGPVEDREVRGPLPRAARRGARQRRPRRRPGRRPRPVADGAGIPAGVIDDVGVLPWNDIDAVAPLVRADEPRGGDLRAGAVLEHRRPGARPRVHARAPRAHPAARDPADLRRGDHGLPDRAGRRGGALRLRTRPARLRQGRRRRLSDRHLRRPPRRDGGRRDSERTGSARCGVDLPVGHVLGRAAVDAGRAGDARADREHGRDRGRRPAGRGGPRGVAGHRRAARVADPGHRNELAGSASSSPTARSGRAATR